MSKALLTFVLLFIITYSFAQNTITGQTTYNISVSNYEPGKYKKDSVLISDTNYFKVSIDQANWRANHRSIHRIIYNDAERSYPMVSSFSDTVFRLKGSDFFSLRFFIYDSLLTNKNDTIKKVHIAYKGADNAQHDTLIEAIHLTTFIKGKTIMSTTDSFTVVSNANIAFINCYDFEVIFYREVPKTEVQKQMEALNDRVSSLFLEAPSNKPIGEFILKNRKIYVKKIDTTSKNKDTTVIVDSIYVDKVTIGIHKGAIGRRQLKIHAKDGRTFFNKNAPVSLAKIFRRKGDRLYLFDTRKSVFIELGDALDYQNFAVFNFPADTQKDIELDAKKERDTLKVGATINQLIDVCIYTDLLGLLGRTPNSILQTEISGNFISNTTNIANRDIVFHSFVKPYIRVSKFDSRFAQLKPSDYLDTFISASNPRDSVNRTYLNQISYLQGGVKMNVVRFGMGTNQELAINFGADINLVNADSLYKTDITFINWYPEVQYRISRLSNFGMELVARFNRQKVTDAASVANKEEQWVLQSQASLYYYPFSNLDNRVFFRFNYFDNLSESRYNFSQFQVGWKTSLFSGNNKVAIKN